MTKITNQILLESIKEHKDVLFGAFSSQLTHQDKEKAWKKVLDIARSVGHKLPENKENDWTYIRDTFWQNHKKRAMLKIGPKTGTAGGKHCKLTITDELVLDIIGRQSPIVQGLGVKDSLGHTHETVIECNNETLLADSNDMLETRHSLEDGIEFIFNDVNLSQSNSSEGTPTISVRNASPNDGSKHIENSKKRVVVASSTKQSGDEDTVMALKRRKLQLQVECLEKQNYKETLEILQLEKKLLLKHSKYTLDLVLEQSNDILNE